MLGLLVGCLVALPVGFAQTPADGQGKVKIEWLGHEFYRLTSPKGVVVITSPWLANPDGPVPLDSLARTDFILVPNAHNDDMGNPIEIAALSGATVITPGPLGNWLMEKGLKKEQFRRGGVGDRFAQEADQRVVDAGVLDAPGREKKLHGASDASECDRSPWRMDRRAPRDSSLTGEHLRYPTSQALNRTTTGFDFKYLKFLAFSV
jgi:hypothetical protein